MEENAEYSLAAAILKLAGVILSPLHHDYGRAMEFRRRWERDQDLDIGQIKKWKKLFTDLRDEAVRLQT